MPAALNVQLAQHVTPSPSALHPPGAVHGQGGRVQLRYHSVGAHHTAGAVWWAEGGADRVRGGGAGAAAGHPCLLPTRLRGVDAAVLGRQTGRPPNLPGYPQAPVPDEESVRCRRRHPAGRGT